MRFLADHDRDHGRAEETVRLDVPSRARQDAAARGGQRREVRDGGARDEAAARRHGQLEHVDEPTLHPGSFAVALILLAVGGVTAAAVS